MLLLRLVDIADPRGTRAVHLVAEHWELLLVLIPRMQVFVATGIALHLLPGPSLTLLAGKAILPSIFLVIVTSSRHLISASSRAAASAVGLVVSLLTIIGARVPAYTPSLALPVASSLPSVLTTWPAARWQLYFIV